MAGESEIKGPILPIEEATEGTFMGEHEIVAKRPLLPVRAYRYLAAKVIDAMTLPGDEHA